MEHSALHMPYPDLLRDRKAHFEIVDVIGVARVIKANGLTAHPWFHDIVELTEIGGNIPRRSMEPETRNELIVYAPCRDL